jgi:DNA-binding winged helix-turn-helix (wHTH) protein
MAYVFGPFELSRESYELRHLGAPVRVEPKVIEVLAYLVADRARTVAKEELLRAIWPDTVVSESALTRAIRDARRALRQPGADDERWIRTVYGRGFQFVGEVAETVARPSAPHRVASAPAGARPSDRRPRVAEASMMALMLGLTAFTALRAAPRGDAGRGEAYQLYLRAVRPLREAACVGRAPLMLLERSLELDPAYAPAWEEYGWARYNLVSSCGEAGTNYGDALRAADRALGLRPRSAHALGLKAAVLVETGRAEDAYALLRSAPDPDRGAETAFFEAYALTYAGFLDRAAERLEDVVRRDPTFFAGEGWTPNAMLYLRRLPRFAALLPAGDSPLSRYYRGYVLAEQGRTGEALAVLRPAFRDHPGDVFARLASALADVLEGHREAASLQLQQLGRQAAELQASDGEVTFKRAQLWARAGREQEAVADLRRAVEQGFFCPACIHGDPALAALRGGPALGEVLARAEALHPAFGARFAVSSASGRPGSP